MSHAEDRTTLHALAAALPLIGEFEGFRPDAYADRLHGWKIPTIGYGTTRYTNGLAVKRGDRITWGHAVVELVAFILIQTLPVMEKIPRWEQLNAHQRAALLSFSYNLGPNWYRAKSRASITAVVDTPARWNDRAWVTAQFIKYRNPGTAVEAGLLRRREAEATLWLKPL